MGAVVSSPPPGPAPVGGGGFPMPHEMSDGRPSSGGFLMPHEMYNRPPLPPHREGFQIMAPHQLYGEPAETAAAAGRRRQRPRSSSQRYAPHELYHRSHDDAYGGLGFSFGAVPASGVAIACLPETTVGVGGEGEESGRCVVCLEEYEAGDALRTMPCTHGFHESCIFVWLRASRVCPICRFALPAEEDMDTDVEVGRDDQGEVDDDDVRQRRRIIGYF